jgi:hypothetical protein
MSVRITVNVGDDEFQYVITNKGEIETGLDMEGGARRQGDYRYRVTRLGPKGIETRWFTHHRANGLEECIRGALAAFREVPV